MFIPAELLLSLAEITSGTVSAETLTKMNAQITELVSIKLRAQAGDPALTDLEKARVNTLAPYNLDAWDGYFYEREVLYATLKALNKKVVVLAGDTHNAWYSELLSKDQDVVGVELATSSVSSPGLEKYLSIPLAQLQQFEYAFQTLINDLAYCNLNQRGYLLVSFTEQNMQSDWIFVNSIKEKSYVVDETRGYQLMFNSQLQVLESLPQSA
jgi:alkaline phosphatase D